MNRDITKTQAQQITGAIRRRMQKVVLIRRRHGIEIRPLHRITDKELGTLDIVGIYDKRATYSRIMNDYNETI